MGFLAWHKLGSRLPLFAAGASGCTFACCCTNNLQLVTCEAGATPGSSGCLNAFDCCEPYPVSFADSICCIGEITETICYPDPLSTLGVCINSVTRGAVQICNAWVGTIQPDSSIIWTGGDLQGFRCDSETNSCQGTEFAGPLTGRITTGSPFGEGTGGFDYIRTNGSGYHTISFADPAFTWEGSYRYYRTPIQTTSEPDFIAESPHCIKIKTQGMHNRTIVLSGYNRYKYAGYLTSDPEVGTIGYTLPRIVDDPGFTGLSQAESNIGKAFPSSDDVLTFPLWGSGTAFADNGVIGQCSECEGEFNSFLSSQGISGFCAGGGCFRTQTNDATGHYLPMEALNFTGNYFSFSGFNPYVKHWQASDSFVNDIRNFGTGLPTCSLHSLAWALYNSAWREIAIMSSNNTEAALLAEYSELGTVRNKLNSLLGDDPRNLTGTNKESVVTYWFSELNDAIVDFHNAANSAETLSLPTLKTDQYYEYGAFTVPKVILWDRAAFMAASTNADRWKSLYIPGSGNIMFDSGCTNTGATAWKAYKFMLDEASHDPAWGSTHAARLIQFRVCDAGDDQVTNSSCISLDRLLVPVFHNNIACELCATSDAPFNMDSSTDCIDSRPEFKGDSTVGTDYSDLVGGL